MTSASNVADNRQNQRDSFARSATGNDTLTLERASMDAGFRSYWRGNHNGVSVIVMDSPPDKEDVKPWLRVRDVLEAAGVRVPRVDARDVEQGFLLLEDLGADTMLQAIDSREAEAWFDQAMQQLVKIQAMPLDASLPTYDREMLARELRLFDDWFIGRHLNHTLSCRDLENLELAYSRLIEDIITYPQSWVHRDFMPRNLMPVEDGVAVLDFQDAVTGPIAYDVLTLFKDAFVSWPEDFVEAQWRKYHALALSNGLNVPQDFGIFQRQLDWIGIQRHLKVIGIFARLCHRDNKPKYVADVARFFAYLDGVVPKYPELQPLNDVLNNTVKPAMAEL